MRDVRCPRQSFNWWLGQRAEADTASFGQGDAWMSAAACIHLRSMATKGRRREERAGWKRVPVVQRPHQGTGWGRRSSLEHHHLHAREFGAG